MFPALFVPQPYDFVAPFDARHFNEVEVQVLGPVSTPYEFVRSLDNDTFHACVAYDQTGAPVSAIEANGIYRLPGGGYLARAAGSGAELWLRASPLAAGSSDGVIGRLAELLPPRGIAIPAHAPTYSAAFSGYAAYATPQDLFTFSGSPTKTVAVLNFMIAIQSTASALQTLDLVRRSAASTGGTSAALTPALMDTAQGAATAAAKTWTTAPGVLGASAGILKSILAASSTLAVGPSLLGVNYSNTTAPGPTLTGDIRRPIILRGAAESINLNYRGAALTAGFVASGLVEWCEFDE